MTGVQMALFSIIIAIAGVVTVGAGGVLHAWYTVAVGAGLLLYALVLAVLSLRDR